MLMLQLYNCTRIYIVKYRQSIAFGNTYICSHFSWLSRGRKATTDQKKLHKLPFVVVLNITLYSLDMNISSVGTTASGNRQERRYPWITCPYRLQHVQFVASQLTIFTALPRTIDRTMVC